MLFVLFIFIVFCFSPNELQAFHLDGVRAEKSVRPPRKPFLSIKNFFVLAPFKPRNTVKVETDPLLLLQAAKDTLYYIETNRNSRKNVIDPNGFRWFLSPKIVKNTLQFLVKIIEEDKKAGRRFRIFDSKFLRKHFGCIRWKADWKEASKHNILLPHDGKIRLTSYAVLTVNGSKRKTANFPCGIYRLLDNSIQTKYTKHQILSGVLERPENKKKRRALAWVSRQSLEDAIMDGTVHVKFTNGSHKVFSVNKSNGISYDRKQKNVLAQKRYWFFKEIKGPGKSVWQTILRIKNRKNVIFAGDLYNIGIGKLIALSYRNPVTKKDELRLGILADTGGAFINNLYQLDLFAGIVPSHNVLKRHLRQLPSFTQAFILYKRSFNKRS